MTHSIDPQIGLSSLILSSQEEKMESADWEVIWSNMRCSGLSPISWQQIGSLELNLPPVQRLPALILISELDMEIHRSRAKKKPLEISIFTSNLKFRSEVIGNSMKHQDGKHELTNWIDDQLIIPDANTERNLPPVVANSVAVDTSHGPM